ncbi:MAG: hypothetical protein NTZ54_16405 [Alphaproteobacteria bacterium]|nr:hypothetical protein [Alphaproteobacteria bacterium]
MVAPRTACWAGGAQRRHQILDAGNVRAVEHGGELRAIEPLQRLVHEIGGRGIGLDDAAGARIDHHDRLGRHLHQQAVARFGVAEPGIFLLDRLFGSEQLLLHGGNLAEIAADGQELAAIARLHHAVAHGKIRTAGLLVVDLAPAWRQAHGGLLQHLLDLRPAFNGGDLRPGLARP